MHLLFITVPHVTISLEENNLTYAECEKYLCTEKSINSIKQFIIAIYFFPKNIFHQSPELIIFS